MFKSLSKRLIDHGPMTVTILRKNKFTMNNVYSIIRKCIIILRMKLVYPCILNVMYIRMTIVDGTNVYLIIKMIVRFSQVTFFK